MSSRAGTWLIAAGLLGMLLALCFLPAAFGEHPDENALAVGVCLFSFGALGTSLGIYMKARLIPPAAAPCNPSEPPRKIRNGCDLCRTDAAIIHCRVHELHLCATCLAEHYDPRSCAYVPSSRRAAQKAAKPSARARGAS